METDRTKTRKIPRPPKQSDQQIIPVESIQQRIYLIRVHKVMLDADLADLYGVTTGRLNEQVRRNKRRFPEDFLFQLTEEEQEALRSQIAISKGRGGRRYAPLVFTEQRVAMLSGVLNSERAIRVNILIMRALVRLRELAATHKDLARNSTSWRGRSRCTMRESLRFLKRSRNSSRQESHPRASKLGFGQVRSRNANQGVK